MKLDDSIQDYFTGHIKRKTLDVEWICSECSVSSEFIRHSLIMPRDAEIIADGLWEQGKRYMMLWRCPKELLKEIRYPLDWRWTVWERFAPAWAKRRWPTRWITHRISEMYPEIAIPGHLRTMQIKVFSEPPYCTEPMKGEA